MDKVPSLVDLCVRLAIDNIRYLGDVGETENHFLDRILSHCTLDQLMHIENSTTVDRYLNPVTDKLWMKFYKMQFGVDNTNTVIERMRQKKVTFKWRQLYGAKVQEMEEATQNSLDRIKQRYMEENAKKQSRQVRVCSKVPPSSRKRSFDGGFPDSGIYNTKSGLMKKAKLEFLNCLEVKNISAMKKNLVHWDHGVPLKRKSAATASGLTSSLSSKFIKPVQKRLY